jgi:hypothetical protein
VFRCSICIIEQQFGRRPGPEMLGTVEKNGGKGAFEILRRVGAGDCCRRVVVEVRSAK